MSLRVGLVGCGNISDTHARAAREAGLEVAAFAGRQPARAAALARTHGGRACATYDELLRLPLDLVAIGSPSGLHAQQGLAAVERGLHVLVEKPIDVDPAAARALVDAAERRGVRLGVMFQERLKPGLLRARAAIAEGAVGRVLLVSARVKWHRPAEYYAGSSWRGTRRLDGGAALVNQGIHTVDLLLWLLGPVREVRSLCATQLHAIEGEDVALALLRFASGAVASLEATTAAWPGYPRRLEVSGTGGTLVVEDDRIVAADLRTPRADLVEPPTASAAAASAAVTDATAHRRLFEDFAEAIRSGGRPACDGREGLRSLELVRAVYEAAASGHAVEVAA